MFLNFRGVWPTDLHTKKHCETRKRQSNSGSKLLKKMVGLFHNLRVGVWSTRSPVFFNCRSAGQLFTAADHVPFAGPGLPPLVIRRFACQSGWHVKARGG